MGVMSEGKLLLSMSLPLMISMIIQALYNIVDSIFVARISEMQYELTAVSTAFPIQNLMIAFGTGIGVGITTLISKSLGEKNPKRASRAAAQGIMLELCSFIIFLLIGLFGTEAFMRSQTDNAEIIRHGVDYLSVCCVFSFGLFVLGVLGLIVAEELFEILEGAVGLFFFNDYAAGLSYYYFVSLLITILQTMIFRWTTDDKKVLAEMEANAKKKGNQKKSGFAARLEAMQREQQRLAREQAKAQMRR